MIKTKKHTTFDKELQKKAREKNIPIRAMFELTYNCNHKCIHCYNTEEQKKGIKKELKTKEVFEILDQMKDLGVFYLGFTGGEIFTREDIFDIFWYAKDKGFEIILLTNASLIDEKKADEIKKLNPNKVDITIHSRTPEIFDKITQVPGSYQRVYNAVSLLKERGIKLGLKACGLRENVKEIIDLRKFSENLGVRFRFDPEIIPKTDGNKKPLSHSLSLKEGYEIRRACYPKMYEKYDEKGRLRKKVKFKRDKNKVFICGAGKSDMTVNPYGELNLCLEINFPRYKILKKDHSLKKGWKEISEYVSNLKPPKNFPCLTCPLFQYCSWCPAKSYLEYGNFTSCSPYSKEAALLSKKEAEKEKL